MSDEQLFPIDIHYNKLLGEELDESILCIFWISISLCLYGIYLIINSVQSDWLIDRRHCDVKWHSDSKLIKEKLLIAVKELSSSEQFVWINEIECKVS